MTPVQENIPSVADLAFRYGTIKKSDLDRINRIYVEHQGTIPINRIMVSRKIATEYQVGLLKLIQDYYIIRKRGEQFGKIAVEKGYAEKAEVDRALEYQRREFKRAKLKKRIGDILVENGTLTARQRDEIVAEQKSVENRAEEMMENNNGPQAESAQEASVKEETGIDLLDEKEFFRIRKQDSDFVERVLEKGLATLSQLSAAEKKQRKEFERKRPVPRIGEILVKWGILTEDQQNLIVESIRTDVAEETYSDKKRVEIEVCETGMAARADINQKSGKPLVLQDIKDLMSRKGIVHGVFADSVVQCFLESGMPGFPVACGDFPVEETDRVILYHFEHKKGNAPKSRVKKGEALAELKLAEKNILGKDVYGNFVESVKTVRPAPLLRPASGARFSENMEKVFAAKTGVPALTVEKRIFVHPAVHIMEDADMRTGPIEKWADISVRGVLSDAFPVKAGSVTSGEIRGTDLKATGDITTEIGITGAFIRAQGNIRARYIHNSVIETFGDVTVENEIIDSTIRIGGKLEAGKARMLASYVSAGQGIDVGAVGSDVTESCTLCAGRDDLVIRRSGRIDEKIETLKEEIDTLRVKKEEKNLNAEDVFKKMQELKKFHDRAEKKKIKIEKELYSKSADSDRADGILRDLESKLASIISSLKLMNQEKKAEEQEKERIESQLAKLSPSVEKSVAELERDRLCMFKWAQKQPGKAEINIRVRVKPGTAFKGVYSRAAAEKEYGPLRIREKTKAGGSTTNKLVFKEKK
ncbi:MAG: FapA family protein [Desulfobacteraceae bacterium]